MTECFTVPKQRTKEIEIESWIVSSETADKASGEVGRGLLRKNKQSSAII